jgi:hypothetical protein
MHRHSSVPIPKFAHPRTLRCELRNQRDTSNFMILVRHFLEFDTNRAGGFEPLRVLPKDKKQVVLGLVTSKSGRLEPKGSRFRSLLPICPSYTVSSIRPRGCREHFQAAIRRTAPQPMALPRNIDAIAQSVLFTSA